MSDPLASPITSDLRPRAKNLLEELTKIAKIQRHLNIAVVVNIAVSSAFRDIAQGISPAYQLVGIAVIYLFVVISAIRMANVLLGETWALVCGALTLVPIVSLATLLILSRRATNRLQSEGIRVGFLGASPDDVQSWINARQSVCVHCGFEAEKADSLACKHCKLRVHRTCKTDHFAEAHA